MNKKFFINILSLILFSVLAGFIVWPKISETLEVRKKHLAVGGEIADLVKTIEKIESLGQELEKNIENQKTVSEYLPSARGDEFLINYLDSIAYAEGVSLSNIGINKKEAVLMAETSLQPELGNNQTVSQLDILLATAVSPKPVFETAQFKFLVNYEKVVALLRKFNSLKRFNEVSDLKITKIYPENNKGDASLNLLQVEMGLDFNHLKKITSQSEIGKNLFSREDFDQATLANIKSKAINGANDLDDRTNGRNNPFIP